MCKGLSIDDFGVSRDTPYLRRYDWELVLKPAILLKKNSGGYRKTTPILTSSNFPP